MLKTIMRAAEDLLAFWQKNATTNERTEEMGRLMESLRRAHEHITKNREGVGREDMAWCPQHGTGVKVDEDGCCTTCGADATGPGAETAVLMLAAGQSRAAGVLDLTYLDKTIIIDKQPHGVVRLDGDQMRIVVDFAIHTGLMPPPDPIPMILTCPCCHARHVDAGGFATKPHRDHACQSCGMVWRPALVPTVGVQFLPGYKDIGAFQGIDRTTNQPIDDKDRT